MRHKGVDKEETKRKVFEAAGRGFRKHGYAGIGVDGLAKSAGDDVKTQIEPDSDSFTVLVFEMACPCW